MAEPPVGVDRAGETPVQLPGWMLALGLVVGAAAALAAAALGWTGVVVIVAILAVGYLLLVRWSSWPRPSSAREDRHR